MDNIRVFLWLTLLGMAWLVYTAWVADYGPATNPPPVQQGTALDGEPGDTLPNLTPGNEPPPQAPVAGAAPSRDSV